MKLLFLDESGDHNLEKIDRQYPLFVLSGVVFDNDYYRKIAKQAIRRFKKKLFGTDKIILHTADITRNKDGFEKLKELKFRQKFYQELNSLMKGLDFTIVACAIKKDKHLAKYGLAAIDPYMLSLDFIVERFIFMLSTQREKGTIIAESRNALLDNQLELAFLNLKIQGTKFLGPSRIKERIRELKIIPKVRNEAGLQMTDLVATPIGRFVLGKEIKEDFRIIEKKFRKDKNGKYLHYGLKIFP